MNEEKLDYIIGRKVVLVCGYFYAIDAIAILGAQVDGRNIQFCMGDSKTSLVRERFFPVNEVSTNKFAGYDIQLRI